jgi:hypothetical protein
MCANRIPRQPPELGIPDIHDRSEVEKRGRAERKNEREKNAVPTPCRFDFTQPTASGFKNGNRLIQTVTNFLNRKNRERRPHLKKSLIPMGACGYADSVEARLGSKCLGRHSPVLEYFQILQCFGKNLKIKSLWRVEA